MIEKVTIVIPCYNQEEYLQDCLLSLLSQSYGPWKAIVVDDCSTVGNPSRIVEKMSDDRISCVRHSCNRGLGAARNTGFSSAQSLFVLPLDCDDLLAPDLLDKVVTIIEESPDVDCVFTDLQLFGGRNERWYLSVKSLSDMLVEQWITGAGGTIRRQLWQDVGGYSEAHLLRYGNEDWDFWIAAARRGFKAIHIPEPLYLYRKTDASMTVSPLNYHDYVTRNIIYQHHKAYFDKFHAGSQFLSSGYLNSSIAAGQRREYSRAIILALRGFKITPNKKLFKRIVRAALIEPWKRAR